MHKYYNLTWKNNFVTFLFDYSNINQYCCDLNYVFVLTMILIVFSFFLLEDCLEAEWLEDVSHTDVELAHELHPGKT